ncbi:MAG: cellulase family glycosylhydrolase [Candidatus Omnitrophota bacterium]
MSINARAIKGVNIGSWLLMEGYILGGRNIAESTLKRQFEKINGKSELEVFSRLFRENFIQEEDFKNISAFGANTVRLPFNCRLIEPKPFRYSNTGIGYLKKALSWAEKYNIKIILDLHAAQGAQNEDWHADSGGKALLWEKKTYRERMCALWEVVASACKDEPALLGYDLLNEPVLGERSTDIVKRLYQQTIARIRAIDTEHTIFLEGDIWAQRIDFLKELIADNICISIHAYAPLEYTFNFTPFYKFPGQIGNTFWDANCIRKYLEPYAAFSRKNNVMIFVGEFGINWRGGLWGELEYLKSMLKTFEEFGFGYTYWTYKAIAHHAFPDGIYQAIANNPYIKREGPLYGWENYICNWRKEKQAITAFWQTKNFTPNAALIETLKTFFEH